MGISKWENGSTWKIIWQTHWQDEEDDAEDGKQYQIASFLDVWLTWNLGKHSLDQQKS